MWTVVYVYATCNRQEKFKAPGYEILPGTTFFSNRKIKKKDEAIAAMERCIKDLQKWMKEAKLQLNTDKTELLLIGTKQQLQKINMSTLCVGNDLIKPSNEVKNLGVWLDPSLTMNTHINKTCSIAFYHLNNLPRRIFITRIGRNSYPYINLL